MTYYSHPHEFPRFSEARELYRSPAAIKQVPATSRKNDFPKTKRYFSVPGKIFWVKKIMLEIPALRIAALSKGSFAFILFPILFVRKNALKKKKR